MNNKFQEVTVQFPLAAVMKAPAIIGQRRQPPIYIKKGEGYESPSRLTLALERLRNHSRAGVNLEGGTFMEC